MKHPNRIYLACPEVFFQLCEREWIEFHEKTNPIHPGNRLNPSLLGSLNSLERHK